MPLSLDDLRKKAVTNRRTKQRKIELGLIESAEERELAGDFCRYFAELERHGKRQRDFSEQYLTERAGGDFKLARGLTTALLHFYGWESETFAERLRADDYARLLEMGLPHPSALRLALYDYVNAAPRSGYIGKAERAEALELFAAGLGLEVALLEELLYLDAEENARLHLRKRHDGVSFRPPTLDEVARRYNRLAVETLLFNSSEVIFGFGTTLPGALVKRIGFLSKKLHIPYDLDYNGLGEVQVRLYGPVQAFGSPTRHGDRLAKLTFMTLALARRLPSQDEGELAAFAQDVQFNGPRTVLLDEPTPRPGKSHQTEKGAVVPVRSTVAQVHIKDKLYFFDVAEVAHYLAPYRPGEELEEVATEEETVGVGEIRERPAPYIVREKAAEPQFDSSVEARFYSEFAALAREGHTMGWQVEREPEAVAIPEHNLLFIPDFIMQRGQTRVAMEIIGFWTADYRARKLEKLEKLKKQGQYKLVLAVAQELKVELLEDSDGHKREWPFPFIFYKNSLRATDLLALLQKEYDDRAGRLGQVEAGRVAVEEQLLADGFVPENQLYGLLKVYNKSELLAALPRLASSGVYLDNYGLCSSLYLATSQAVLETALLKEARLSLDASSQLLQEAQLTIDNGRIEALLAYLPGLEVARPSLFEVFVQREGTPLEAEPLLATGTSKSRRTRR